MSESPRQPADPAPALPAPRAAGGDRPEPVAGPLPRARDRAMLALFALALALQLLAWSRLEGYQLADSVEYMERAQSLARGEPQHAENAVRSFGFSIVLAPFFLVADALGLEDGRQAVGAVRVFQMLLGLGLVLVCARIGALLAGRRAGLVAGALVALNPIFLQYSVSPVSGVAAALCVALGIERLMLPAGRRRAFAGGLALGAAFLMAYQTILVSVPLLLVVLARDRRSWRGAPLAATAGLVLGILAQVALDRVTWGVWGASIGNYVLENARGVIVTFLLRIGQEDAARWVYERSLELMGLDYEVPGGETRQLQSRAYYLTEITRMLAWPVVAVLSAGFLRALRRPSWKAWLLILVLAANVLAMSMKGAKSFRLWLPLLPMLAPLCAFGLVWLGDALGRRSRAALVALVLVAAGALGLRELRGANLARFGTYWRAAELVNELAGGAETPPVLVSAYHWAVFAREAPGIELAKLPHHLHEWPKLAEEKRAECIAAIGSADWMIAHRPVLLQGRDLFDAIDARFEVVDWFWTPEAEPSLGAVLVLRARTSAPARVLTGTLAPEDPAAYRRRLGLDRTLLAPMDFIGRSEGSEAYDQRMTLLGFEVEELPASGFFWITYYWTAAAPLAGDYTILDRLTDLEGRHAWQNNHGPGWGFRPTSAWEPGAILREGYPLLPGSDPFTARFLPMGGPYRRGERIPLELWMTVVHQDAQGAYVGSLRPAVWGADRPLDMRRPELLPGEHRRSAEGHVESPDKLARLARFLLPVHPLFHWPSDGRPDPP